MCQYNLGLKLKHKKVIHFVKSFSADRERQFLNVMTGKAGIRARRKLKRWGSGKRKRKTNDGIVWALRHLMHPPKLILMPVDFVVIHFSPWVLRWRSEWSNTYEYMLYASCKKKYQIKNWWHKSCLCVVHRTSLSMLAFLSFNFFILVKNRRRRRWARVVPFLCLPSFSLE